MNRIHALALSVFIILSSASLSLADPYGHALAFDSGRQMLLIDKVAEGEAIDYCIYISPEAKMALQEDLADRNIAASFELWTKYTAAYIKSLGREMEFGNLYRTLAKGVRLNKLPSCNPKNRPQEELLKNTDSVSPADISFIFLTTPQTVAVCGKDTAGCRYKKTIISKLADKTPLYVLDSIYKREIIKPSQQDLDAYPNIKNGSRTFYEYFDRSQDYLAIVAHELGHSFGLGDQYDNGPLYSSFVYSTPKVRMSIMSMATFTTCDDMDGFITLLDRASGTRRTFRSLCDDGIEICDGTARYSKMIYAKKDSKGNQSDDTFYLRPINDAKKVTDLKKALKESENNNFLKNWFVFK